MSRVVPSGRLFISANPGPDCTILPLSSATLKDSSGNVISVQNVGNSSQLNSVENSAYQSGTYSFNTNYKRTYYKNETYTDSEGDTRTREVIDYIEEYTRADISVTVSGSLPDGISHSASTNYSGKFAGTPSESIHGRTPLPVPAGNTYPTIPFTFTVTATHPYQTESFTWTIWVAKNWDEEAQDFLDSIKPTEPR